MSMESLPKEKGSRAAESPSFQLVGILKSLQRISSIPAMKGEKEEDPVAQEILNIGPENIKKVELFLQEHEITSLAPLEGGYGFSAVVLDAGNKVVRLSKTRPTQKPNTPHVLQPLISKAVGRLFVQISKKLETKNITEADVEQIQNDLKATGYSWDDAGTDNIGRDENGNLFVIDGSVKLLDRIEKQ